MHVILDTEPGSLIEPSITSTSNCKKVCPCCLLRIKDYMLVIRPFLSRFFAHAFINCSIVDFSPAIMVSLLHGFLGIRQISYFHPRSVTEPENKHLQSTMLQLIASGTFGLKLSESDSKEHCYLSTHDTDSSLTCLNDNHWITFFSMLD